MKVASGQVWLSSDRATTATVSWRTAEGRYRNIGGAPPGAELVTPTVEDGYLLLVGHTAAPVAA
jgi:ABC-2 type transport system ATP-binding protein